VVISRSFDGRTVEHAANHENETGSPCDSSPACESNNVQGGGARGWQNGATFATLCCGGGAPMRFTLRLAVWLFLIALVTAMGLALWQVATRATRRVSQIAQKARTAAEDAVVARVDAYLKQGDDALLRLEKEFAKGRCQSVSGAESCLLAALVGAPDVSEVTFITEADGVWQLSVFRAPGGELCTTHLAFGSRQSRTACRLEYQLLAPKRPEGEPQPIGDEDDPTDSFGYMVPFRNPGRVMRSDLSRSRLDASLVRFLSLYGMPSGVLKVGLFEPQLREAIRSVRVNNDPKDPFKLFLCDTQGRLVAGLSEHDRLTEYDDAFRIDPSTLPPEVTAALKHAAVGRLSDTVRDAEGSFELDGRTYHVALRALDLTQGWAIGVVGPDDYYLGEVTALLRMLFALQLSVALLVLAASVWMVQALRSALVRIETETERMRRFEFAPAEPRSVFSDVRDALWNLELAKTAMRALSRFVPVPLVRRLFEANQEPTLGSEPREVSMMFTDIEGFTALVEREEPLEMARWLGDYFAAMTRAVHAEGGIVDKFIGDAVMALWNAPNPLEAHPVHACAAALRCLRETEAMYASQGWAGRPKLVTRFGLHAGTVLVGHFGAPDRVSYTAIGDGVNLASRLEGLNKVFGTRIVVSQAVEERARGSFEFRRLDRVAVKGKSQAVAVYELLGAKGERSVPVQVCDAYEQALAAYCERDFGRACALLRGQLADSPSRVLHERCLRFQQEPPAEGWDGTLMAEK
jgi:adenylate cyclase